MAHQRGIAILGAGNVGTALGRLWTANGHAVVFGVPDPRSERVVHMIATMQGAVRVVGNAEAASTAEVVALCVPWGAAQAAIRSAGNLAGKIVIDCTNPLADDLKGLVLGLTTSAAEQVQGWAPGAKVVKAFNTVGAVNFGHAQFGAQRADGFYCGDDRDAKAIVKDLVADAGLDPVDVGPLVNARLLEPLAMLWIDLAVNQRQGTSHAFKLLRR
jgi:8-hydroxy-5-deazaflavin:NADPH oxidoreductase